MADFDALKSDFVKALQTVPPSVLHLLVNVAETIVTKERDALEKAFPVIKELLTPHIGAIVMEAGMGILDVKTMEATLMDALKQAGNGTNAG